MSKNKKIVFYIALLLLGFAIFILQVFIFQAPNGVFGFLLCLTSIYFILGSIIKLCKMSKLFKDTILGTIFDFLFWLP